MKVKVFTGHIFKRIAAIFVISCAFLFVPLIFPSCMPGVPSEEGLNPPSNLIINLGSIDLEWKDNSNNEDGFIIERAIDNYNQFIKIAVVDANVTEYIDTEPIRENKIFYYRVSSFRGEIMSPYSNTAIYNSMLWTGIVDVRVEGNYAYCAMVNGFMILDISNILAPQQISTLSLGPDGSGGETGILGGLEVEWNFDTGKVYAYMAYGEGGLKIIDVTDPYNPTLFKTIQTEGVAASVYVTANRIYISEGSWADPYGFMGVEVFDISFPFSVDDPGYVGSIEMTERAMGIYANGNYLYVANINNGVHIIDMYLNSERNPNFLKIIGTCQTTAWAKDVFVRGNYVYVSEQSSDISLEIFDIKDKKLPILVSTSSFTKYNIYGDATIIVNKDFAYITSYAGRVGIIDIKDPVNPILVSAMDGYYTYNTFVSGNYAFIADTAWGMSIWNVSDPNFPEKLSYYQTPSFTEHILLHNDKLYVSNHWSGMKIYDIFDPANPKLIYKFYQPYCTVKEITAMGNYAFIGGSQCKYTKDGKSKLYPTLIMDISDPENATVVNAYEKSLIGYVQENYLYAWKYSSIEIEDLSDPVNPKYISEYKTDLKPSRLVVSGKYAYIAEFDMSNGRNEMEVVDVSDVQNPIHIGKYMLETQWAWGMDVTIIDNYIYFLLRSADTEYPSLLIALDVTDPQRPVELSKIPVIGNPISLLLKGDKLYIASGEAGISIYNIADKKLPKFERIFNTTGWSRFCAIKNNMAYIADTYSLTVNSIETK